MFERASGDREALYWEPLKGGVVCNLCNHRCNISNGKRGICGVREAKNRKLYTFIYGRTSSIAVDPVEKKPLYHFKPGSSILSLGTVGCNFRCLNCQNNDIACARPEASFLKDVDAEKVPELAIKNGCQGVAWTYNEPTIWYEFTLEASKLVKKAGLDSIYVTNGYITPEALEEHAPYMDAMNIDVKAFTDDFYKKVVGARLQPVLDTCVKAKELGIHVEITYLIIPNHNDDLEEIRQFSRWVVDEMGLDTPVHFSRFFPQHKMTDISPTPLETLGKAYDVAKEEGIPYVYLGNVRSDPREDSFCHNCGTLLLKRSGFSVVKNMLDGDKCSGCGATIPVIL